MTEDGSDFEIAGVSLERGTSIYHQDVNRVMWFKAIRDGYVKLGSVEGLIDIEIETFEQYVSDGTFEIESRDIHQRDDDLE